MPSRRRQRVVSRVRLAALCMAQRNRQIGRRRESPNAHAVPAAFFACFCKRLPTGFPGFCPPISGDNRKLFRSRREAVFSARIIPL
ncbi:hypothetical protein C7S17_4601 [Burkholderia thailandensis]|nr:hypothetical protein [Burkholderia thailandensis]